MTPEEPEHYTLSAGDAFLIDCNEPQYYGTENPEGWTQSALHFFGGNSDHIYETLFRNLPLVFHLSNEPEFQSLLEDILRCQTTPSVQHDFKVSLAIQKIWLTWQA
ncbi:MAG: AraC family ligand binding domain-containing protein [Mediterraneibacter gnavus]